MSEIVDLLKRDILAEVPQVPYVLDQVGHAIDWCIEANDEGSVVKVLKTSLDVAKYAKSISEPNFYKTHLLIASLIGDIDNVKEDAKFEMYNTASGIVAKTIDEIIIDKNLIETRGCFNALSIWLTNLARTNEESFVVMLYGILNDLKESIEGLKAVNEKAPITPEDYVQILGDAYVLSNLRMSNLSLLDSTREIINQISIILNNDVIY
jgi:hypothetical protein